MCNRAQSSPRIWAMAMGSTTEHIGFCSGEAWATSLPRASIPSLRLNCALLRLRGPGASQALRPRGQVICGGFCGAGFSEPLGARKP